jgi:hypothetical protein
MSRAFLTGCPVENNERPVTARDDRVRLLQDGYPARVIVLFDDEVIVDGRHSHGLLGELNRPGALEL